MNQLLHWHSVEGMGMDDLPEGKVVELTLNGKKLCLLRKQDQIFAFAATCPHQSARLCEGWMDARGHVVCPLHHYRFDPANGRNTSGEGYKLRTYPLEVRDEIIYIGFLD